jgi:hypothetical protein
LWAAGESRAEGCDGVSVAAHAVAFSSELIYQHTHLADGGTTICLNDLPPQSLPSTNMLAMFVPGRARART